MQRTLIRRAQYGLQSDGARGLQPWRKRVTDYQSFKSQYGPDYKIGYHMAGVDRSSIVWYGYLAAGMGGAAGIFALFFFDGVPRVQQDILQKVPFIGDFYKHEVPPEDNPF
ncbi:hypothetical protein B0A50_05403 [Salinomyces thailandicus]|uniref:Cytochrome b-c1 complex subunit 10 n=1 Tax=Salinomyces thailandicus TaxID=706561 RepID=A0A4U0TUB7_9PEZI|nr:hypothetical protein B0A50_05403 [Salinomyces thailandica]